MPAPVVIVGAGQAAAAFISRHVALGNAAPLLLIGKESHPPYQRPPLSKKYLLGQLELERLFIRPLEWYAEQGVETRFSTCIVEIRRADKQVVSADGDVIDYDRLILCTGSRPRKLPADAGGNLPGVYTLRDIDDIDMMSAEFKAGRRLLIVGGGYIGLEAAAAGRQLGLEVTLLEMADRILQRVAAQATSSYFRKLHSDHGVDIRESARMLRLLDKAGRVCGAEMENGTIIDADLVLVGIGASPNTELAAAAGLDCDNGICVNEICQTADTNIFAAGDCTSFTRDGMQIRLESVQNAADQGDLIARVLAGEDVTYTALPWFWSDQYDCKLQIVGLNLGHDQTVIRRGASESSMSVWYYRGDRLLAIDAMNDPRAYAFGRKMIAAGKNPTQQQVADPTTDLKALAES
ncbi:MAG: FAD-dependent oxidoreductase [Gammaproteobacteria bacterium]|nr:FAD-dependent oxidoreductase [Gammaproteobacteria bacterium]MDH3447727.1 FAD-dependent oxidoreductase [Gammaproteobacteria bacterium]